jgi:hypothetical protein
MTHLEYNIAKQALGELLRKKKISMMEYRVRMEALIKARAQRSNLNEEVGR